MTMTVKTTTKTKTRMKTSAKVPPRNPNKRQTTINMKRSIGRMKANDMDVIRQAR